MEGVADRAFRKAIASIGGFDEAVTEFISVPVNAHPVSLAKTYDPKELSPVPIAAQIMGAHPEPMVATARELEKKGASRIDINCGCPSNTVTGRGAGSGLLRDPSYLLAVASEVVKSVSVPVTIKMRSGYEDTSLFRENLLAAEESGVAFITVHPRTKTEGYGPPANRELIALAKTVVKIPIVGNGDIISPKTALDVLGSTGCDALMIGRGAVTDPFIFRKIKSAFSRKPFFENWEALENYLRIYLRELSFNLSEKGKIGKLKQLMGFLFKSNPVLLEKRKEMLKTDVKEATVFLDSLLSTLKGYFFYVR